MNPRRGILLLLLFAIVSAAHAQVRYLLGDDAKWAAPSWDDSSWQSLSPTDPFPTPPVADGGGILWFRYRVSVPPSTTGNRESLAIRSTNENMTSIPDEVWVNGRKVGGHGKFPPHPESRLRPDTVVFDLPPGLVQPGDSTALVAWRVWVPPIQRTLVEGLSRPLKQVEFEIAPAETAREREKRAIADHRFGYSLGMLLFVLEALFGFTLIALWRTVRGAPVLRNFGWFVAATGALFGWALWPSLARIDLPLLWYGAILRLCNAGFGVSLTGFFGLAFEIRSRWIIRTMQSTLVVAFVCWFSLEFFENAPPFLNTVASVLFLGGVLSQCALAIYQAKAIPRTRALAVPLLLFQAGNALQEFSLGPIVITSQGFSAIAMTGVMSYILLRRTWKEWQIREELSAEFEAARAVQARLVPPAQDVPGFRIESAYQPAKQVGGDFFRILPREDGSVLVVTGDVSGKGLNAAMIVATVIGALRNEFSSKPAEVLAHLNRSLLGNTGGGFVTCCCALLHPGGTVVIANAGHIAPYVAGNAAPMDSGLPLGVIADADYTETTCAIGEEQLTFVSDGVVEAANAAGELFGFERTREISTRSAAEIAEAARAWGQNDDITVVTVRRTATLL